MSVQSAREFLMKVANDKSLGQRLAAALEKSEDKRTALIALAAIEGFEVEEADLTKVWGSGELSDQALDAVAGGFGSAGLYGFNPQPEPPKELNDLSQVGGATKGTLIR